MRLAEEKAEKAEKTCEEQKKMDKSNLALVMQKMKTAEQQRDGYKKQVGDIFDCTRLSPLESRNGRLRIEGFAGTDKRPIRTSSTLRNSI